MLHVPQIDLTKTHWSADFALLGLILYQLNETDRQTDIQKDRETERQTDRQKDRQAVWQTDEQAERQKDKKSDIWPAELRNLHSQTFILEMLL